MKALILLLDQAIEAAEAADQKAHQWIDWLKAKRELLQSMISGGPAGATPDAMPHYTGLSLDAQDKLREECSQLQDALVA
jgi:hypothetical protein